MRRLHRPIPLLAVLLLLVIAAPTAPATLQSSIDGFVDAEGARTAFWGIHAVDLETGRVLYSRNADKMMMPASNQKLVTTVGALDALGSDYRYQTTLWFDGQVEGSVMQGDLILEGSGDPTFGSYEINTGDPLRAWAQELAAMGVTRIEGRLIGDDDAFDNQPYAEGWDIDYVLTQSSRALGVSASGLAYRDNVVEIRVENGEVGEPPVVRTNPQGYLDVENKATTSGRRRGWALDFDRIVGSETIRLSGSLPRRYAGTIEMPVFNPTTFTLHSFRARLQEAGIEVTGALVDVDDLEEKPTYDDGAPLFVHLSPPLSRIVEVLNKESNNFYAEQVFRTFAWGGSAEGGQRRIEQILGGAGVSTESLSVRDGSGLSRKNMITPEAMVHLLEHMYDHPEREAFLASLAQGGEAQTTLRGRLGGVPVQAKTGSLEFVRTLSGYATTADGRPIAFAIFANNYAVRSYRITQTIDQVVRSLTSERPG